MERDMVLIRKILFAIEEKYTDRALSYHDLGLNDYTPEVVAYHCMSVFPVMIIWRARVTASATKRNCSPKLQRKKAIPIWFTFWMMAFPA